jgi:hypothetical protein
MAVVLPQNSQGLVIPFSSGTFVMTGFTAIAYLKSDQYSGNPVTVPLTLVVQSGGLTANYTTVGGEFKGIAGLVDAQLKVFNGSGTLLYSAIDVGAYLIQPPLG